MLKAIYSEMASLEGQTYTLSTLLFVSVKGNVCSVSEDATDHQDGPAVPIVGVCTLAVSCGDSLASLVPDSWGRLCQMCGVHPLSPLPNHSVSLCLIQLHCHHGEKAFLVCSHLRLVQWAPLGRGTRLVLQLLSPWCWWVSLW